MLLYSNLSDYLPTTEARGVRVTVHKRNSYPFPDSYGKNAATGYLTAFRIKRFGIIRMSAPHGDCSQAAPDINIYVNSTYTHEACQRSCFQHYILRKCGCTDPLNPGIPGSKPCHSTQKEERDCLTDIHRNRYAILKKLALGEETMKCICKQPCTEYTYQVTGSMSRWPSSKAEMSECRAKDELCRMRFRENAAMVEIYYERLYSEVIRETAEVTLVGTLANVGGTMGLWISVSAISILEVLMLFYRIMFWDREDPNAIKDDEVRAYDPDGSIPFVDCTEEEMKKLFLNEERTKVKFDWNIM